MIRLSCWIGGVGCAIDDKALVGDLDQSLSPVMQTSPVKRCIDADIDASGDCGQRRFMNVAPRLARYFHSVDSDEEGESSLGEIMETWRKYRDRLIPRKVHDCLGTFDNAPKDAEAKAPCLTDAG